MNQTQQKNEIKIQSKRNVELWIYSFADMYMILSVFFIALSVIYAAKSKQKMSASDIPTAGRGPAAIESSIAVGFSKGTADLEVEAIENLNLFLPVLKSSPQSVVEVEGYADNTPVKKDSDFSSNLDLSTRRAVRVSEWLMSHGVSSSRLRTISYGNSYVYKVDENMKTNRRVVIKLSQRGANP
ncbi:MAG TPA: OmpA family protein [Pseudobdellovibrionaceae bacterium]|nr:OmpA family protein [Pseudobdellovibrionaceae bacterium]